MRKLSEAQLSSFISFILGKKIKDLELFTTLQEIDAVENFEPREYGGFEVKMKGLEHKIMIYKVSDRFNEDISAPDKGFTIILRKTILRCDEKDSIARVDQIEDPDRWILANDCSTTFEFRRHNVKLEDITETLDELKKSYERMLDLIDDSKIEKHNRQREATIELSTLVDILEPTEIKLSEVEPLKDEVVKPVENRLSRF